MEDKRTHDKRLWLGVIFVIVGGIWLLDNVNIIPDIPNYLVSWESLLILIGVYLLLGKGKVEPGIVMIAVGGIFLLEEIGLLETRNIWQLFWPAIIIIIGLSLIFRRNTFRSGDQEKKNDLDYIDDFTLFGGRELTVNSQQFKGGKLTTLFGGSSIDLRSADLYPGRNVIDVFAMFGGASLIVPPDWAIKIEVVSVLGAFSDNRSSSVKVIPNNDKVLVITGFVMFGGGDIKLQK